MLTVKSVVTTVLATVTVLSSVSAQPAFDKQGHRGARGLMPENTIAAMKKAIDIGVTTLETDVVMTRDGKLVCSHEPYFNHDITTRPDGSFVNQAEERSLNIFKMDYSEVIRYDVGRKAHPQFPRQQKLPAVKPLLSQLIDSVEAYVRQKKLQPVFYNIETKISPVTDNIYHPAPKVIVDSLVNLIRSKGIENRVIIQSFDFRSLQVLHKDYPRIVTAALVSNKKSLEDNLAELGFTPAIYSPNHTMVTEELVRACHQKNIRIIPWTVNDKMRIAELKRWGVDGIITDYPDLF